MDAESEHPHTGVEVAESLAASPERRRELSSWARSELGLSETDIEDVLQETYLELLRFQKGIHSPEGFVFRVFQARCRKLRRSRRSRPDTSASDLGLADVPAATEPLEDRLLLVEGLRRLSPTCRKLILAYYFEGKMPRETVHEVHLASPKVVSMTTSRCLRRLREWLQAR